MASDDLDAPLGKKPKRKTLTLPVTPPQIVAGLLGTTVVIVALWTAIADDPYGGEPIAVVATRLTTANAKDHDIAAAAGKPGEKIMPAAAAAPAPPADKAPATRQQGRHHYRRLNRQSSAGRGAAASRRQARRHGGRSETA